MPGTSIKHPTAQRTLLGQAWSALKYFNVFSPAIPPERPAVEVGKAGVEGSEHCSTGGLCRRLSCSSPKFAFLVFSSSSLTSKHNDCLLKQIGLRIIVSHAFFS